MIQPHLSPRVLLAGGVAGATLGLAALEGPAKAKTAETKQQAGLDTAESSKMFQGDVESMRVFDGIWVMTSWEAIQVGWQLS